MSKRIKVRADSPSSVASPRSGSPPRALSPLEAEIAQLVRDGIMKSTADLVQHFRQRLKQDPVLKEQLSAAVKRIAYMDKQSNQLRLKEGY